MLDRLEDPIADLELSVRARNCLDGADMNTLRDIVSLSENEMMTSRTSGRPA